MAAPKSNSNGSLLSSLLNSPSAAAAALPANPPAVDPSLSPPPSAAPASVSEPIREALPPFPKKPGRGSNLARFGIAVVLLLACVALLGHVGRQPLKDLYYQRLAPLLQSGSGEKEGEPAAETPLATVETSVDRSADPVVETVSPKPGGIHPPLPGQLAPGEPPPTPPKTAPSNQETAGAPSIAPVPDDPDSAGPMTEIKRATPALPDDLTPITPAAPPKPAESLIEVPGAMERTTSRTGTPEVTVPDEAKPAAEALLEFLSSESLEGKRKFILGVDDPQIKALVERYYGQADPGPIPVTSISLLRHDPNPEVGGGMQSVFMVASPEWTYPIPVMLQETKNGFKLDWIAFIEFKDNMLLKFVQAYRDNPSRFHVSIKRSHYFERDVPDLENKDCFIIQPPQEDFEVSVFVPKNTPLAEKLRRDLSWSTQFAYVLAEIQWRDDGTHQWIELTAVPQLNWYITTDTPGAAREAAGK